jgi:membrane protease YdiL (CAAX protease family)
MQTPPDDAIEPGSEAPVTPPTRWYLPWVLLLALFGLLIGFGLQMYFEPKEPGDEFGPIQRTVLTSVRMQLRMQSLNPATPLNELSWQSDLQKLPANDARSSQLRATIALFTKKDILTADQELLSKGTANQQLLGELAAKASKPDPKVAQKVAAMTPVGAAQKLAVSAAKGIAEGKSPVTYAASISNSMLFGLAALAGVAAFGLGVILWIYHLYRRQQGIRPAGHPSEPLDVPSQDNWAMRAFQMILLFFAGQTLCGVALRGFFPKGTEGVLTTLAFFVGGMLAVAVTYGPIRNRDVTLAQMGAGKFEGKHLLYGAAGFCMNLPLLVMTLPVLMGLSRVMPSPSHPASELLSSGTTPINIIATFIAAAIFAPLFEELMFRGALFGAIREAVRSLPVALVVTNLLFAAVHPTGVPAWIALATIGITATLLTIETRSIYPAMIFHGIHNGSLLILNLLLAG